MNIIRDKGATAQPTNQPTPIARAAIAALDAFGTLTRREAVILLGYWARRDQLTATDVSQVLAHYPDTRGGAR